MPAASTRTRTSPGPGACRSRPTTASGAPAWFMIAAFTDHSLLLRSHTPCLKSRELSISIRSGPPSSKSSSHPVRRLKFGPMRNCPHLPVQSQCRCMDSGTNQSHLHHPHRSSDGNGGHSSTITAQNGTRRARQAGMGFFPLIGNTLTSRQVQFGAKLLGIGNRVGPDFLQLTVQKILDQLARSVGKQGLPASSRIARYTSANPGWDGQVPVLSAQNLDIDDVVTFENTQLNGQARGPPEVEHRCQGQAPKILWLLRHLPQFKTPDADLVSRLDPVDKIVLGEFREYPHRGRPGKSRPARDLPSRQDWLFRTEDVKEQ